MCSILAADETIKQRVRVGDEIMGISGVASIPAGIDQSGVMSSASVSILKMAMDVATDNMEVLLADVSEMTGVGTNIDIYA